MNYEEKYKKGLSFLKDLKPYMSDYCIEKLEGFFPELRESEDELMRKEAISIIKQYNIVCEREGDKCYTADRVIAWLEKQGEQKPTDKIEPKFKVGDWIINNDKRIAVPEQILKIEEYGYVTSMGYISFDKVKTDYHLWTIQDARAGDVLYLQHEGVEHIIIYKGLVKKNFHTFLSAYCAHNGFVHDFCFADVSSYACIRSERDEKEIHPATKSQRDTLFAKMKEAGYEWDDEKKELKKIEQSCYHNDGLYSAIDILEKTFGKVEGYQSDDGIIEHQTAIETVNALYHKKPAEWSEEDEQNLNGIITEIETNKNDAPDYDLATYDRFLSWLKSLKDRVQPQPKQEWSEEDEKKIEMINNAIDFASNQNLPRRIINDGDKYMLKDWLKSLKPRWKPSEEQMKSLKYFIDFHRPHANASTEGWSEFKHLESLYNSLLKL